MLPTPEQPVVTPIADQVAPVKKKYRLAAKPAVAEEEELLVDEEQPAVPENRDLTRKVLNYLSAKVPR